MTDRSSHAPRAAILNGSRPLRRCGLVFSHPRPGETRRGLGLPGLSGPGPLWRAVGTWWSGGGRAAPAGGPGGAAGEPARRWGRRPRRRGGAGKRLRGDAGAAIVGLVSKRFMVRYFVKVKSLILILGFFFFLILRVVCKGSLCCFSHRNTGSLGIVY